MTVDDFGYTLCDFVGILQSSLCSHHYERRLLAVILAGGAESSPLSKLLCPDVGFSAVNEQIACCSASQPFHQVASAQKCTREWPNKSLDNALVWPCVCCMHTPFTSLQVCMP